MGMMDDMKNGQNDQYATRKTLIARVQNQQNERAWEEFIEIYRRYVYAVIRNMNISEADAQDIHQNIMIKLWEKLPNIELERITSFRGYLSTITKNEVLQFIRSSQRRVAREEKAAADSTLSYLDNIRLPEIDKIADQEWRIHLTNLALKNIESLFSKNAIEVFRLCIQGWSTEEVMSRTGLSESTVNTLKSRVKTRFNTELEFLKQDLE
ncbi:RNA polymerase sigma factor [Pontiella desulfatans]|nr:RNA polymerase sigma factor [Pontiella desulfatans]